MFCQSLNLIPKENLSLRKNVSQSTTDSGFKASNAVDGDITTCMRTKPIGGDSPYESVWWMVDLGGVYNIHRISIIFKNYEGFGKVFCLYS